MTSLISRLVNDGNYMDSRLEICPAYTWSNYSEAQRAESSVDGNVALETLFSSWLPWSAPKLCR